MLILHGAVCGEDLLVWGEVPLAPSASPRGRATRVSRRVPAPLLHAAAVSILQPQLARLARAPDHRSAAVDALLWTPTVGAQPVPSSALIAPSPAGSHPPTLQPWTLTTLCPDLAWLLPGLRTAASRPMLASGIVAGPDFAYWGHAVRFALALVTQGRFFPWVVERSLESSTSRAPASRRRAPAARTRKRATCHARWQPLLAGDDLARAHELAAAMPDACRALSLDDSAAPDEPAVHVLVRFVARVVDTVVRAAAQDPEARTPTADLGLSSSPHDAWLNALRSRDDSIAARDDLTALPAQVAEWQRPTLATVAAPYRLLLRLREPAGSGTDAPPPGTDAPPPTWRVEYLVQRADDRSLMVPAADIWRGSTRARQLLERGRDDVRTFLLEALGQASRLSADVLASLSSREPDGYDLDVTGAYLFLSRDAWTLEQAGFGVLLPAWWTRKGGRARLAARAHVKAPRMKAESGVSLDTMVSVRWEAAMGNWSLSPAELEALSLAKLPLVQVRGQWVEVTADDRARAAAMLKHAADAAMRAGDVLKLALGANPAPGGIALAGVDADGWLGDLLARLQAGTSLATLPPPPGFVGELRPYQARGSSWLAFLTDLGLGACLADDMGLGKTVQTLALVEHHRHTGLPQPVLLICPTSVVGNWQKEVERFTPGMRVMVHHGQRRARRDDFLAEAARHDLVISSYALLVRDLETLSTLNWHGIVLDEAQNIKNPETRQARAARALRSPRRIALTGTPVENHVGDLWSIMEFLNPGLLGTQTDFKRRYFVPIQATRDPAATEALKRATGPFVLRRLKTDPAIAADLPDKLEMKVFCTLTREQASLYAAVVLDLESALRDKEGMERRGLVLATLSKLKQVCNHPAQFLRETANLDGRSGKLARLTDMLDEIGSGGERALVFTQFAEMGTLITRHLEETFGQEVFFLHGGVPRADRDRMVERFQSPDGPAVFVLSLKAGGTGLNLTSASHVFLYDRWWNPAVENQAIDRAFRIGQQRNVQVHKFVCAGTLEERIDEMIERKKGVAAQTVGTGEAWLTELSTDDLRAVIALGREAVAD